MNRLSQQSSPYLAQHKDNPVDWWPWCDEAFMVAKQRNIPIFLSIGYASCHWCHVMAHESFENQEIAQYLNLHFVSIKVDREERPDVDSLYMESVQAMSGSGGWPLSVFLFPDGRPFYGGTYYPPFSKGNMPGFPTVLETIVEAWTHKRSDLEAQANYLRDAIIERTSYERNDESDIIDKSKDLWDVAVSNIIKRFDRTNGGFGSAPKFPQSSLLEVLMAYYLDNKSEEVMQVVRTTLDAMCRGGIYDHIGGGFARYSVDAKWQVPHFEKMLYDQAQLSKIYTIAWTLTKDEHWKNVAIQTVEYALRDLYKDGQGFFSSQDADSEGVEGKYYLFSKSEIEKYLGDSAAKFIKTFGISEMGNFEGSNILHIPDNVEISDSDKLEEQKRTMLGIRYNRVPPALDEKVILEWNAFMVANMVEAGFIFAKDHWIDKGLDILDFLESQMYKNKRWLRIWKDGTSSQLAFASDYAHIVNAYTRAGESSGKAIYIDKATKYANQMLDLFEDENEGGLFTAGKDQETLMVATKDVLDNSLPSANSMAGYALGRLARLTGDHRLLVAAEKIVSLAGATLESYPHAFPVVLLALPYLGNQSSEIVIPGTPRELLDATRSRWTPNLVMAYGERYPSPIWEGKSEGYAYLCKGYVCSEPTNQATTLSNTLENLT